MAFNSSIMYYVGTFVMCVAVIAFILCFISMQKLRKNQEEVIELLRTHEYHTVIANDMLHNMENDLFIIKQRGMEK